MSWAELVTLDVSASVYCGLWHIGVDRTLSNSIDDCESLLDTVIVQVNGPSIWATYLWNIFCFHKLIGVIIIKLLQFHVNGVYNLKSVRL